jgi:hypothetical protein
MIRFQLNKPCVGLASSTAYASKKNLDILVSLFGARKQEIEGGKRERRGVL